MSHKLHELVDQVMSAPGVLPWRMRRFDEIFSTGRLAGQCRGLFDTYEDAEKAAPSTQPLGFDHEATAAMYVERTMQVYPSDYPAMLWLGKAFAEGATRVFDLGGHIGIGYYAYQRYLGYPSALNWQIFDVPAVMKMGREVALQRDTAKQLTFTEDFSQAANADILFSSGCLQFLQDTLAEKLSTLHQKPRRVLVNLIPLHSDQHYWTVHSTGTAFCPYRIQKKSTFFAELEQLGYELIDVWENAEKRCPIAFEPEHSLEYYYGAMLKLRD